MVCLQRLNDTQLQTGWVGWWWPALNWNTSSCVQQKAGHIAHSTNNDRLKPGPGYGYSIFIIPLVIFTATIWHVYGSCSDLIFRLSLAKMITKLATMSKKPTTFNGPTTAEDQQHLRTVLASRSSKLIGFGMKRRAYDRVSLRSGPGQRSGYMLHNEGI